jgi:rhamnulokinase
MLQAKAAGVVTDIWQMRHIIRNSVKVETYQPQDKSAWDEAYEHYCKIVNAKA